MKNLIDELREIGLSGEQAKKSIEVVYDWVNDLYPVLAVLARPIVKKELERAESGEMAS